MRERHYKTDKDEPVTQALDAHPEVKKPPREIPPPGRTMSFEEAKKAAVEQLDVVLTRLSK